MDSMKIFSLAIALFFLGLTSCQLSSEKAAEAAAEEARQGNSIPPPQGLAATSEESPSPQEELPDLTQNTEPRTEPKKEVDVIKMGDFEFKNVLETLPSQRDLAAPPAPINPAPSQPDGESGIAVGTNQPLVTNP